MYRGLSSDTWKNSTMPTDRISSQRTTSSISDTVHTETTMVDSALQYGYTPCIRTSSLRNRDCRAAGDRRCSGRPPRDDYLWANHLRACDVVPRVKEALGCATWASTRLRAHGAGRDRVEGVAKAKEVQPESSSSVGVAGPMAARKLSRPCCRGRRHRRLRNDLLAADRVMGPDDCTEAADPQRAHHLVAPSSVSRRWDHGSPTGSQAQPGR